MKNKMMKKLVLAVSIVFATQANAQIPVTDVASISQQIIDYANQGLQYSELLSQYNQMLTNYSLELQNLAALPGTVRNQVQGRLLAQLNSNLQDFGVSYQGGDMLFNPNAANYYTQLEQLLKNVNGEVPRQMTSVNTDLAAMGMPTNSTNPVWQSSFSNRMKYEGMLDNLRANALMRNNSANRSNEANNIATQMANLPANNTVGAIQLLAAQNSLGYAQQEEVLKQQAIANRLLQQQQVEMLTNEDTAQKARLTTLSKFQSHSTIPTAPF